MTKKRLSGGGNRELILHGSVVVKQTRSRKAFRKKKTERRRILRELAVQIEIRVGNLRI